MNTTIESDRDKMSENINNSNPEQNPPNQNSIEPSFGDNPEVHPVDPDVHHQPVEQLVSPVQSTHQQHIMSDQREIFTPHLVDQDQQKYIQEIESEPANLDSRNQLERSENNTQVRVSSLGQVYGNVQPTDNASIHTSEDTLNAKSVDSGKSHVTESKETSSLENQTIKDIQNFLEESEDSEPGPMTASFAGDQTIEDIQNFLSESNETLERTKDFTSESFRENGPIDSKSTDSANILSTTIGDAEGERNLFEEVNETNDNQKNKEGLENEELPGDELSSMMRGKVLNPFYAEDDETEEQNIEAISPADTDNEDTEAQRNKEVESSNHIDKPSVQLKSGQSLVFVDETIASDSEAEDRKESSGKAEEEPNVCGRDDERDKAKEDEGTNQINDYADGEEESVEVEFAKKTEQTDEENTAKTKDVDTKNVEVKKINREDFESRRSGRNSGRKFSYVDLENPSGFLLVDEALKREDKCFRSKQNTLHSGKEKEGGKSGNSENSEVKDEQGMTSIKNESDERNDVLLPVEDLNDLYKLDLSNLRYTIPENIEKRMKESAFFKMKPKQKKTCFRLENYTQVEPKLPQGFKMWRRVRSNGVHIDRDFLSPDNMYSFRSRAACVEYIKLLDDLAFTSQPSLIPGVRGLKLVKKESSSSTNAVDAVVASSETRINSGNLPTDLNQPLEQTGRQENPQRPLTTTAQPSREKCSRTKRKLNAKGKMSRQVQRFPEKLQSTRPTPPLKEKYLLKKQKLHTTRKKSPNKKKLSQKLPISCELGLEYRFLTSLMTCSVDSTDVLGLLKYIRKLPERRMKFERDCAEEVQALTELEETCKKEHFLISDINTKASFFSLRNRILFDVTEAQTSNICLQVDTCQSLLDKCLESESCTSVCTKSQVDMFVNDVRKAGEMGKPFVLTNIAYNIMTYCKLRTSYISQLNSILQQLEPHLQEEGLPTMVTCLISSNPSARFLLLEKTKFALDFLVDAINLTLGKRGHPERLLDAKISSLQIAVELLACPPKQTAVGQKSSNKIQLKSFAQLSAPGQSTSIQEDYQRTGKIQVKSFAQLTYAGQGSSSSQDNAPTQSGSIDTSRVEPSGRARLTPSKPDDARPKSSRTRKTSVRRSTRDKSSPAKQDSVPLRSNQSEQETAVQKSGQIRLKSFSQLSALNLPTQDTVSEPLLDLLTQLDIWKTPLIEIVGYGVYWKMEREVLDLPNNTDVDNYNFRKVSYAIRNALNHINRDEMKNAKPLTNISLETSRFQVLQLMMSTLRMSDTNLDEVTAAAVLRGDDFIREHIAENIRLYHEKSHSCLNLIWKSLKDIKNREAVIKKIGEELTEEKKGLMNVMLRLASAGRFKDFCLDFHEFLAADRMQDICTVLKILVNELFGEKRERSLEQLEHRTDRDGEMQGDLNEELEEAVCVICEKTYTSLTELVFHFTEVHYRSELSASLNSDGSCPSCTYYDEDRMKVMKHLALIHDKVTIDYVIWKCSLCPDFKPEKDRGAVIEHLHKEHNIIDGEGNHMTMARDQEIKCPKAGCTFKGNFFYFKIHTLNAHVSEEMKLEEFFSLRACLLCSEEGNWNPLRDKMHFGMRHNFVYSQISQLNGCCLLVGLANSDGQVDEAAGASAGGGGTVRMTAVTATGTITAEVEGQSAELARRRFPVVGLVRGKHLPTTAPRMNEGSPTEGLAVRLAGASEVSTVKDVAEFKTIVRESSTDQIDDGIVIIDQSDKPHAEVGDRGNEEKQIGSQEHCKECNKTFKKAKFAEHVAFVHYMKQIEEISQGHYTLEDGEFRCSTCSRSFSSFATYQFHYAEKHSSEFHNFLANFRDKAVKKQTPPLCNTSAERVNSLSALVDSVGGSGGQTSAKASYNLETLAVRSVDGGVDPTQPPPWYEAPPDWATSQIPIVESVSGGGETFSLEEIHVKDELPSDEESPESLQGDFLGAECPGGDGSTVSGTSEEDIKPQIEFGEKTIAEPTLPVGDNLALISDSPWVARYKKFIRQKNYQEIDEMLTISNSDHLNEFLEEVTMEPENFSQLDKVVEELEVLASINLCLLDTVKLHLLLKLYWLKCEEVKTPIRDLHPMHIVIFLSQMMAQPNIQKQDLYWLMKKINYIHAEVDGNPVALDKKILDFFEAIELPLSPGDFKLTHPRNQKSLPTTISGPLHRCKACGKVYDKEAGLQVHIRQFCKLSEAKKSSRKATSARTPAKTVTPDCYFECPSCDKHFNDRESLRAHWSTGDELCKANLVSEKDQPEEKGNTGTSSKSTPSASKSGESSMDGNTLGLQLLLYRTSRSLSQSRIAQKISEDTGVTVKPNIISKIEQVSLSSSSRLLPAVVTWLNQKIKPPTDKKEDRLIERLLNYSRSKKLGAAEIADQITSDSGTEFTADLIGRLMEGTATVGGPKRKVLKNWIRNLSSSSENVNGTKKEENENPKPGEDLEIISNLSTSCSNANTRNKYDEKTCKNFSSKLKKLKEDYGWSLTDMCQHVNTAMANRPNFKPIKINTLEKFIYNKRKRWNGNMGQFLIEWMEIVPQTYSIPIKYDEQTSRNLCSKLRKLKNDNGWTTSDVCHHVNAALKNRPDFKEVKPSMMTNLLNYHPYWNGATGQSVTEWMKIGKYLNPSEIASLSSTNVQVPPNPPKYDEQTSRNLCSKLRKLKKENGWTASDVCHHVNAALKNRPDFKEVKPSMMTNLHNNHLYWSGATGQSVIEWMKIEKYLNPSEIASLSSTNVQDEKPEPVQSIEQLELKDDVENEDNDDEVPTHAKYCLDCEVKCNEPDCDHTTHQRKPVVQDFHTLLTGHTNFSEKSVPLKGALTSKKEELKEPDEEADVKVELQPSEKDESNKGTKRRLSNSESNKGTKRRLSNSESKKGTKRRRSNSQTPKPKKKSRPNFDKYKRAEHLNPVLAKDPYFSTHPAEVQYVTETEGFEIEPRLPEGWTVRTGIRHTDRFYKSPDNHQFRSLKNAMRYIELLSGE